MALAEVVTQRRDAVKVSDGQEYRLLGVRWWGEGAFHRETVTRETSKATTFYKVEPGQFIYNRLFAGKGSFGTVIPDFEGAYVSNEFPLFDTDTERLGVDYLNLYFQQRSVWDYVEAVSTGTTKSRNRWKEGQFLAHRIPLPPLPAQERIVRIVEVIDAQVSALGAEADALDALLRGRKEELFAHYAATEAPLPIGEVLEEVKRPIIVAPETEYWQIGIRSHGRGLFTKEAVTGASLGSKKVFWVEPGDLLINIVFAWEGAVAIVPPEIEGYCGSHRFPAYRRLDGGDVEFFRLFFSTKSGTRLLASCSPGGAGRNRTLNRKRLMQSPVGMPSAQEQERAICELQALEAPVVAVRAEADRLRAVRTALLSGLLDHSIALTAAEREV
ncbi:restriction endonuclease subunit S [Streptomyces microflavus]|uniref:restriction endonuclease subunit S n=1 Tax=Streptomyces microflavus TaxID=1919 RepID=UPI0003998EDA|nr:restriction endonuclease subunit S [Streptomyces microflavus]